MIICVGAQSAKEILGKTFKLTQQCGQWFEGPGGAAVLATIHPAYVLIQPEESFERLGETLFADFRTVAERHRRWERAARGRFGYPSIWTGMRGSSRRCRAALQPDPIHLPGRDVRP